MRLKRIKICGFKSFADSITVNLPSNKIGVIGPNGCGKSNIVDAIRWVLGESSAKQLRAEQSKEILFNGTKNRNPVSQGFVELVFDNSDQKISGAYATYTEIVVKRNIDREGTSAYFLNGTRCRRRDIVDLFLGTGLGPRSYAIIEQGMISRLIEAKPEDLLAYVEEVAQVSKYKERRKETLNLIQHTEGNLLRITDLISELDGNLAKLQTQATNAKLYRELKEEERLTDKNILHLDYHSYLKKDEDLKKQLAKYEQEKLNIDSEVNQLQLLLEQNQSDLSKNNEEYKLKHDSFSELKININRIQQHLDSLKENREKIAKNILAIRKDLEEYGKQKDIKLIKLDNVKKEIEGKKPQFEKLSSELTNSKSEYFSLESELKSSKDRLAKFGEELSNKIEKLQKCQAEFSKLQALLSKNEARVSSIWERKNAIALGNIEDEVAVLEKDLAIKSEEDAELQKSILTSKAELAEKQNEVFDLQRKISNEKNLLASFEAKLSALKILQDANLDAQNKTKSKWMSSLGLSADNYLMNYFKIESGWEKAAELILGDMLKGLVAENLDNILQNLANDIGENGCNLFYANLFASKASHESFDSNLLISKINPINDFFKYVLDGVYCADNISEAKELIAKIGVGDSVVTKDGVWLTNYGVRIAEKNSKLGSLIVNQQQIEDLQVKISETSKNIELLNASLAIEKEIEKNIIVKADDLQKVKIGIDKSILEVKTKIAAKKEQLRQLMHAMQQLTDEEKLLVLETNTYKENISKLEKEAQELSSLIAEEKNAKEELVSKNKELDSLFVSMRERYDNNVKNSHSLDLELKDLNHQCNLLQAELNNYELKNNNNLEQIKNFEEEIIILEKEQQNLLHQLTKLEQERLAAENNLSESRKKYENDQAVQAELSRKIKNGQENSRAMHENLDNLRIKQQEFIIRQKTILEELESKAYDLPGDSLAEDLANRETFSKKMRSLKAEIEKLGPVNLTAIDEYSVQLEKSKYLSEQAKDLQTALSTLHEAMSKIDQDSALIFNETFEKINTEFRQLFPKVFKGGEAYLKIMDNSAGNPGIMVFAQPPGKRNSSIHALSGGEKALTALALVFAFFKLNPAPFCILDEVDAPLDDANVNRYCALVEELGTNIQFVFITHNKNTMQMAEHLIGVTMREPGVSHLVGVDLQQALAYAE